MSQPAARTAGPNDQLLHLVFGGELEKVEGIRFTDLDEARHRRHLSELPHRLRRLARQGAGDRRQRPHALFHRPSSPPARTGDAAGGGRGRPMRRRPPAESRTWMSAPTHRPSEPRRQRGWASTLRRRCVRSNFAYEVLSSVGDRLSAAGLGDQPADLRAGIGRSRSSSSHAPLISHHLAQRGVPAAAAAAARPARPTSWCRAPATARSSAAACASSACGTVRGSGTTDPARMFEKGSVAAFRGLKASLDSGHSVVLDGRFRRSDTRHRQPRRDRAGAPQPAADHSRECVVASNRLPRPLVGPHRAQPAVRPHRGFVHGDPISRAAPRHARANSRRSAWRSSARSRPSPPAPMQSRTGAMADVVAATIAAGYRFAGVLLRPAVPFILSGRVARGKEDPQRLAERYGRASLPRPPGRVVWVHAASVGETNAILPLIERLTGIGLAVVFTTTTVTSAAIAAKRLPRGAVHQFAPLDLAPFVGGFLAHWRPNLAIFVELEMWPTMVRKLDEAGIPLVVVNARLSERSFRGWQPLRRVRRHRLPEDHALPRPVGSATPRASPGSAQPTCAPSATSSSTFRRLPPTAAPSPAWPRPSTARPVWVAASTHEGEEEIVAEAHRLVCQRHPQALTIVVPRHPERGDAVRATLAGKGLTVAQRSRGNPLLHEIDVYLADTLGELGLFYRLAPIAFLGGSLIRPRRPEPDRAARVSPPPCCTGRTSTTSPTSTRALDAAVPGAEVTRCREPRRRGRPR